MPPDVSRRRVLSAGAWAAPAVVVAGATPAFAGSARRPEAYLLDWATAGLTYEAVSGDHVAVARPIAPGSSAPDVVLRIRSTFMGQDSAGTDPDFPNLTVSPGTVGATGGHGLVLSEQFGLGGHNSGASHFHRVDFTFNRGVTDLVLTVTDIDHRVSQRVGPYYSLSDRLDEVRVGADVTVASGVWSVHSKGARAKESWTSGPYAAISPFVTPTNVGDPVLEVGAGVIPPDSAEGNATWRPSGSVSTFQLVKFRTSYVDRSVHSVPTHVHVAAMTFMA